VVGVGFRRSGTVCVVGVGTVGAAAAAAVAAVGNADDDDDAAAAATAAAAGGDRTIDAKQARTTRRRLGVGNRRQGRRKRMRPST